MTKKFYNKQLFKIELDNNTTEIILCATQNTNYGFRHVILSNSNRVLAKRCYYNRTWERFCYESLLQDWTHKKDFNYSVKFLRG